MGRRRWMMNIVAIATVLACFSGAQTMASEVNEDKHIIGIDLGTTYSCVGVYRNGKVEILPNDQGNRITPSMVGWTSTGDRLVGDAAKNQATMNAENTVFDVKRLIGRDFHDKSVQNDLKMFPFKVVNKDGKPHVQVKTHGEMKTFAPEEVSAMVLQKMKTIAEEALSTEIKHAVVTVPAYFNDAQRQATKDAGKIAGLVVERIINEPTAASLAIETTRSEEAKNILVFDLGGGTFDVTILTVDDEVYEVLSTNGDTHLGGEDFDQRVMAYYVKKIRKQTGKDISGDKTAMQKLRKEVERAKRTLSSQHQTRLEIDSLVSGFDFSETLTRARFEDLNMDLFQKTLRPVENALKDAKLKKKDIDEIVLVGGSTRIPKVRQLISDFFDGKQVDLSVNPDEAVAYGAALQGAILNGKYTNAVVLDVMPLSLGIETVGGMMTKMIDRNTNIPAKKTSVFSTNQDNQPAVSIKVFEGERALTKDNHALGEFELTGIPPAPRGVPQIEVTFEVDANSILQVSAREKGTGKTESLTITRDSKSLSEDEIERMIQEAEEFAEEDKRTAARIAASNKLEGYCYNLKNQLKDEAGLGGKLSAAETASLEEVISETLDWLDENSDASLEELEEKQKDVEAVVNPVLRTVYEGSQSGQRDDNDFDFDDDGFDDFDEDHDEL